MTTLTNPKNLLPCPWPQCRGTPRLVHRALAGWNVECECGCSKVGDYETEEAAALDWNTRAHPTPPEPVKETPKTEHIEHDMLNKPPEGVVGAGDVLGLLDQTWHGCAHPTLAELDAHDKRFIASAIKARLAPPDGVISAPHKLLNLTKAMLESAEAEVKELKTQLSQAKGEGIEDFRNELIKEFERLKDGASLRDTIYLDGVLAVIETHGKAAPQGEDKTDV